MAATTTLPSTLPESPALVRRGPYLIAVHGGGLRVHRLRADRPTTVGRSSECDLAIDAPLLAPVHFSLTQGPPVLVRDLRAASGTRLNGRPVTPDSPVVVDGTSVVEASGVLFVLRSDVPADMVGPEGLLQTLPAPDASAAPDDPMSRVHERVAMVARSSLSVVVTGETGVGKEIVSRTLHAGSSRKDGPFVALNCAALPETLLESELFGYERGSFTGAVQAKAGLIEAADGGTLFLDEIGEMPLPTQAKLLRVLESGELARVGAIKPRHVDVRVVAATNRDLPALVARGGFRADLYFRLNGITIRVPSLRERASEIPGLARHFLDLAARRVGRPSARFAPEVLPLLLAHAWPGNVRELRNVMDRALALSGGSVIRPEHVLLDRHLEDGAHPPSPIAPSSAPPVATPTTSGFLRVDGAAERREIEAALARSGGNQKRAAALLSISRRSLLRRLDQYGIARPRKRVAP